MGRLFQYNRFGQSASGNINKDINARSNAKPKESNPAKNSRRTHNNYKALACPSYSELYPEYKQPSTGTTTTTTETLKTTTTLEEQPMTTSTSMSSSTTLKSVELAIKKYQQWSNKFLTNSQAPATQTGPETTTTKSVDNRLSPTCTSTTSSSYHSQQDSQDTELLVTATQRKARVYDCMKGFLKRKLFQQTVEEELSVAAEEDATSDYEELDVLDSSYNADEEYETDSSSSCIYANAADIYQQKTQLPAALTLTCWPNKVLLSDTTSSTSHSEEDLEDESDAGISDCCQLLTDKSPKRRSPMKKKKRKQRYNISEDDELEESTWYQPHLSNKAAAARLQHAAPGTFLLRRKKRSFELLLRLDTKIKPYTLSNCDTHYKFKGAKKEFSSLKALVTHHSVMAEHLPLTLTLPRQQLLDKEQPKLSLRCADDFDSYESLQILGILKRLQAENLEFS